MEAWWKVHGKVKVTPVTYSEEKFPDNIPIEAIAILL